MPGKDSRRLPRGPGSQLFEEEPAKLVMAEPAQGEARGGREVVEGTRQVAGPDEAVSGAIAQALRNFEQFHGLLEGSATVEAVRASPPGLTGWGHAPAAGNTPAQVPREPGGGPQGEQRQATAERVESDAVIELGYSQNWFQTSAGMAASMPNYRAKTFCTNSTGGTRFRWGIAIGFIVEAPGLGDLR